MSGTSLSGRELGWFVVAGAGVGVLVSRRPTLTAIAVLALVCGLALTWAGRSVLWWLTLALYVVVPVADLPFRDRLHSLTPPMVVLAVLALHLVVLHGARRRPPDRRALLLLGVLAVFAVGVAGSAYHAIGTGWLLSFGVLVCGCAYLGLRDPGARTVLLDAWTVAAGLLGAFAVVETFVLQANPLYAPLYARASPPLVQHWSVYRATTSLGHPVDNGIFFAVSAALLLGVVLRRGGRWRVAALVLALGGVVASGSRAALFAAVVGCAVTVVGSRPAPVRGRGRTLLLVVALVVGALSVNALSSRSDSSEASSSARFRVTEIALAVHAVHEAPWFGTGAGTASFTHERELSRDGGAGAFESIWLEAAVGTGLVGLAALLLLLLAAALEARRKAAWGTLGGLAAYVTAASAYNVLEGGRAALLLLGLLVAMAFCPAAEVVRPVPAVTGRRVPAVVR